MLKVSFHKYLLCKFGMHIFYIHRSEQSPGRYYSKLCGVPLPRKSKDFFSVLYIRNSQTVYAQKKF